MNLRQMSRLAKSLDAYKPLDAGEDRTLLFDTGEPAQAQLSDARELASLMRREWAERGHLLRLSGALQMSDQLFIEPLQPIMMVDGTQITGVAEASLWPIQYSSLAGNFLHKSQQHMELAAWGVATTPGATPGTATVTPRWGTTTGGAALGPSAASPTLTISKTNVPWYLNMNLLCRQIGTGATSIIVAGGDFVCDQIAIPGLCFGGTVVSTVDTTAAAGIWVGMTLGAAGDLMTTRGLIIKNVS